MPTYIYKARNALGELIKGTLESPGKEQLVSKLQKSGYLVIFVKEASASGVSVESFFERLTGRVGSQEMIMFIMQFSNMINSGIFILDSLNILSELIENKKLKNAIYSIKHNVEAGESFHEALTKYPSIFPKLFVNMVRAGEESGKLGLVLKRYAEFLEYQEDLRQKITGAIFYPIILLGAGIGVTVFIVTFIIPQFAQIFTKVGIRLPVATLMLYRLGMSIKNFWYLFIAVIIGFILAIKLYINTGTGRLQLDTLKLRLPIIGPLCRKAAVSRFTKTLSTLVSSGIPILESLNLVKDIVGNEVLKRVIQAANIRVKDGESLSKALNFSGEMPLDTIQMIAVGEEAGNLDNMLDEIADFYNMSLGYAIKKLTTLLEPMLLVVMGCVVGFIMVSLLLPIFDMVKIIRH